MSQTIEVDEKQPGWLTTDQAAARMRLTRRQFETRIKAGDISASRYRVAGDRQYYYDPSELMASDLDDMQEESGILDTPTAALLAQAYAHNEVLMKQVNDMTMQLLAHSTEENQKLRDRCGQLEQSQTDLIRAREEMLSDQHARDLATAQVSADTERKDKALSWLMQIAPQVLQTHVASKMSTSAMQLLETITPEQIQALLELQDYADGDEKFLSEQQEQVLRAMLDKKIKQAAVKENVDGN